MVKLKELFFSKRVDKNPSKGQVIMAVTQKKTPLDYAREEYARTGHYTTSLFYPYEFCKHPKRGKCKGARRVHYHSPDAPHDSPRTGGDRE